MNGQKKEKKINKLSLTKTQYLCTSKDIIKKMKPGKVADACNSSTQQAQARGTWVWGPARLCLSKDKQDTGRKYLQNLCLTKDLCSEFIVNFLWPSDKNITKTIKKWAKDMNRDFDYKCMFSKQKDISVIGQIQIKTTMKYCITPWKRM